MDGHRYGWAWAWALDSVGPGIAFLEDLLQK